MTDGFDPFAAPHAQIDPMTRALVLSSTSDWRFGPAHSRRIADGLRGLGCHVADAEIASTVGHDSFLLTVPDYQETVARFLSD
jgi:homoserine O-acetyltransferase